MNNICIVYNSCIIIYFLNDTSDEAQLRHKAINPVALCVKKSITKKLNNYI